MSAMPTGLTKHDRIVNTIWSTSFTNKLRRDNRLVWAVGLPRMDALWCASCPSRAESDMMPNVIRHTEQRGKGRLQDGQPVACVFKKN